jgi:hypothetical protein
MLTIIESGPQAWALAAADGDLHVYSREQAGEWIEVLLSEDSEQIDQDGSSILEALYEQYAAADQDGQAAAQAGEPELEDEELEGEEEPEDEEQQLEGEEEPEEAEEEPPEDEDEEPAEEEKPRRSRTRTRAKKK